MDIVFRNKDLGRLETDPNFTAGFDAGVVKAYRKRIWVIRNATNERDFYAFKSWHCEKLKADRPNQWSIMLNKKWRLIFQIIKMTPSNTIEIIKIEDYH